MAHNSAHYSLVNVGVGFMQCYDRTRVNPDPPPCTFHYDNDEPISLGKMAHRMSFVIYWWLAIIKGRHGSLLGRVCLTRPGSLVTFSRYKELLGHKDT